MTKIPEGFSRNVPTQEGRALGEQLARMFDVEQLNVEARFPGSTERCKSCAFRAGTFPNGCPETVLDAVACLLSGQPFYCHVDVKEGQPTKLCAGWAVLQGSSIVKLIEGQVPPDAKDRLLSEVSERARERKKAGL